MNGPALDPVIPLIPYGDTAEPSDFDGTMHLNASKYVIGATLTIDGGISWGGKSW